MDLSKQDQHGSIKTRSTWIYQNKINMDLFQNKVNMDPLKQDHDKHGFIKTR